MLYIDVKGLRVPALGLGTWELTGAGCARAVRQALEIGYRHIDTAQAYENEAAVGRALAESGLDRGEVFLSTKIWMSNVRYDDAKRSVDESLRALRTDHVDLLLIHWPVPAVPVAETLRAMIELRAEGRTRAIGVSNFTVPLLEEAAAVPGADLVCNQVEYHPFLSQRPVLDWLRRHGMMLTAYSPLARGEVFRNATLRRIGERHGKSAGQVALRWLVQQERVSAIPKASGEAHMRSNFEIFDFALDDEEMAEIGRLTGHGRRIDPSWAPHWDPP